MGLGAAGAAARAPRARPALAAARLVVAVAHRRHVAAAVVAAAVVGSAAVVVVAVGSGADGGVYLGDARLNLRRERQPVALGAEPALAQLGLRDRRRPLRRLRALDRRRLRRESSACSKAR